jgi:sarcosine oxidase, subunit alpha
LTQGNVLLDEGAQVTSEAAPAKGTAALGHVTSSYHSPASGRPIALALVKGGRGLMGRRMFVPMPKGPVEVEVVSPVFYDPKGEKLNG